MAAMRLGPVHDSSPLLHCQGPFEKRSICVILLHLSVRNTQSNGKKEGKKKNLVSGLARYLIPTCSRSRHSLRRAYRR